MRLALPILLAVIACASASAPGTSEPSAPPPVLAGDGGDTQIVPPAPAIDGGVAAADSGTAPQHGWNVAALEDFESAALPDGRWSPDPVPDDGPFADNGSFF